MKRLTLCKMRYKAAKRQAFAFPEFLGLNDYPSRVIDGDELAPPSSEGSGFRVRLNEFEGPFDLLLHLISKHKLEVTELALHEVTDEFIAHIRDQGAEWDLNEATEFLVIAATLLDLKAARLLPSGEVEDEEDLAVFEARDLLFARLLQYKAFKDISDWLSNRFVDESRRFTRAAALEEPFASLLPEVLLTISPQGIADLALKALSPKPQAPAVSLTHLHSPVVSVREQAFLISERIRRRGVTSFRALVADAEGTAVVVARFLALLELYRERVISFEQSEALSELMIRWSASPDADVNLPDQTEFDQQPVEEGANERV